MTNNWRSWCWQLGLTSSLAISGAIADSWDCARAQVMPHATQEVDASLSKNGGRGEIGVPWKNVLRITSLTCHSTAAGGTNPDQISLYVRNQLVWGPSSMNAGNQANLTTVVETSSLDRKVLVELSDQSKSLGSAYASAPGGGQIQIINGNATYTLTYQTELILN